MIYCCGNGSAFYFHSFVLDNLLNEISSYGAVKHLFKRKIIYKMINRVESMAMRFFHKWR